MSEPISQGCTVPPDGWFCTREPGHDGPCAAHPATRPNYQDGSLVAKALRPFAMIAADIQRLRGKEPIADNAVIAAAFGVTLTWSPFKRAMEALASLSTPASYSQRREDDPAPAVAPEDDGLAAEWAKIVESARFNGGYHYFVTPAFAEQTLAALRRPSQQTEPVSPEAGEDRVADLVELEDRLTSGTFYSDYDEDCRLLGVFQRHLSDLRSLPTPEATHKITPSSVAGEERIERDLTFAAIEHLSGIEDPHRITDERGNPFLTYTGQHVVNAFKAGASLTSAGESVTDAKLLREAAQAVVDHGRLPQGRMRSKWIVIPVATFHQIRTALSSTNKVTEGERDK